MTPYYKKTLSVFARKYSLEIIPRNISKALLHSHDTFSHRIPGHQVPELSSQLWSHTNRKKTIL